MGKDMKFKHYRWLENLDDLEQAKLVLDSLNTEIEILTKDDEKDEYYAIDLSLIHI